MFRILTPILGEMIRFDGCIFFKWVGEKPTTKYGWPILNIHKYLKGSPPILKLDRPASELSQVAVGGCRRPEALPKRKERFCCLEHERNEASH